MAVTTGFQGNIAAGISGNFQKTVNSADGTVPFSLGGQVSFVPGTGAGAASMAYLVKSATIAGGGAPVTYDLYAALTDFFGASVSIAGLKGIVIINETSPTASPATLLWGADASAHEVPYFGDTDQYLKIPAGWSMALVGNSDATKFVVTNGTGDKLTIANADPSNTLTYSIAVIGV